MTGIHAFEPGGADLDGVEVSGAFDEIELYVVGFTATAFFRPLVWRAPGTGIPYGSPGSHLPYDAPPGPGSGFADRFVVPLDYVVLLVPPELDTGSIPRGRD